MRWADGFGVASPTDDVERAVLMAPSATTHANDMNQKHIELRILRHHPGAGLDLIAPPGSGVAPPGFYMLFLLNSEGVPSIARFLRIGPDAGDQPLIGEKPVVRARITSGARKLRRRGRLVVTVAANRPVALRASARLRIPQGRSRKAGIKTRVVSKPRLRAGHRVIFRFPKRLRSQLPLRPRIMLRVRATDVIGNTTALRRTAKLRRGR